MISRAPQIIARLAVTSNAAFLTKSNRADFQQAADNAMTFSFCGDTGRGVSQLSATY